MHPPIALRVSWVRSTRAALVSEFDDEAGLASYATSPEHVEVVETLVKPTLAGPPVAVDYLTGVGNTADLGAASVVHVVLFKVSEKAPTADFAEACNSLQALDTLEVSVVMCVYAGVRIHVIGFLFRLVIHYCMQPGMVWRYEDRQSSMASHISMSSDKPTSRRQNVM